MYIEIPQDRPTWESEIATYWFEDEILISLSKSTLRTVEKIKNNVALVQQITQNKPALLLIYMASSPIPDKETRQISTDLLPKAYRAMAMVSKPGLATFVMDLLFKFKPSPIPIKLFSNSVDAKKWLSSL